MEQNNHGSFAKIGDLVELLDSSGYPMNYRAVVVDRIEEPYNLITRTPKVHLEIQPCNGDVSLKCWASNTIIISRS